ncbi:hypothetical protein LRO89_02910 [Priestia megaterium]|uniref:hypothetical protein n=1 Tax=Priestia megaterium TaxID=1404 RepID=UPI0039C18EE9
MTTELTKKYSAKMVKDCFKVGDNFYRAVEMGKEDDGESYYALQDIKNGGTTLFAVSMEEILKFIGENYELVTTVATYETPMSQSAHYILPQSVEMWVNNWQHYFQQEIQDCQRVINNEAQHLKEDDSFYVKQAKVDLAAVKHANVKIDKIFK